MKTITKLGKQRDRLMKRLDDKGISDPLEERILADIEDINWKIANSHASDIDEILLKARLLAEVSGTISLHTIEGALLISLIDDLGNLSK